MKLEGTGVWSAALRYGDPAEAADAAAELEELGYRALWVPDIGGDVFDAVGRLLGVTRDTVIATGILNLWMHDAAETAAQYAALINAHGARFLVGIGVSHAPLIDMMEAGKYQRPMAQMAAYLDGLDAAATPLPASERVLAALGPKMLELARDRAGGAHPYLANAEHTAVARGVLGAGPLLAPEQPVVLDADPDRARAAGRAHMAGYLGLPNYRNNLLRLGFTDDDVNGGGSDRLVDSVVAWGDVDAIASRVQDHRDAGADHVCVQVLGDPMSFPRDAWRELAPALTG
ncbi:MAG TPA: LLM class F420-dependent oxidoreductase [Acidimicrobiales bacterium]|nr:LLM class F420-dependent oxidoreductase [Acidimicrobiales bacterium]